MHVYCSLPLRSSQARLQKALAESGVSAVYAIHDTEDLHRVARLATLSQASHESIVLRIPYSLVDRESSFLNACVDHGFRNYIFSAWLGYDFQPAIADLSSRADSVGLELLDSCELNDHDLKHLPINLLVLKGHEAGGIVGSEHTHMLFHAVRQRLAGRDIKILIEGGIGIQAAGVLSLMGASGVILEDQLRLATDYPAGREAIPRVVGAHETLAIQICQEYYLRIPRNFGQGFQQSIEAKIAACYPLQSVSDQPGLVFHLLSQLDLEPACVQSQCLGQDFGFAREYAERYADVVSIASAFRRAPSQANADLNWLLQDDLVCDNNFSADFSLSYDLMQGPMTRVSDTPEFIAAVSEGGALSFFAAAMLSPEILQEKLMQTKQLLSGKTWGVGLLGFLPREIRDHQFAVVKDIAPPCVLIAGGRPDQAEDFESCGIQAFIHAPTLDLLQQYVSEGATNLILEGRECGGHVGPVGSLVLWEQCLTWLTHTELPKPANSYHIVLAGGIADPASCATARILSAKPKAIGVRMGILTGTPYLYTDEAVSTGAIVESYRETVIGASRTVNLETGAGHASRCAVTPFAHEFQQLKDTYITAGLSGYQLREELEKVTLGRLRLATKGIKRNATGLVSVSDDESYRDGMYMLGQSAALLGEKTTISELHQRLTSRTSDYMRTLSDHAVLEASQPLATDAKVAIVAMDCMMPDSCDLNRFWEILISGEDVVKEVPAERWDPALYYTSDKGDRDRVYSKWGGFLPPIAIDTVKLGIPPVSLKKIEPLQILTLELITRLFEQHSIDFSQQVRDRTAVFLGAGGGIGDMGGKYAARSEVERIASAEKSDIYARLPEWGDETFPGLLFNVVAGRVANRLNLKGASYTVDAACASSLAAIYSAYRELTTSNCDLAIAGGVDTGQSPFAYLCFSRSQALSPTGRSMSFDQQADGIAISEGLGVVVMKRLHDALRDGDDIIAVIDGVGAASDGRGSSLTSPQSTGQQLAVERAWQSAGFPPSWMSLYEAHGTGTVAGDRTEIETVLAITQRHAASPQSCAVSSTKPNIGHTKSSAGIAGLMHAALCIHHRVLSPQIGASTPLKQLQDPSSPIFLNRQASFWPTTVHGRKAGVSAFGFGGTNYHIVLSEPPEPSRYIRAWPKSSHYLFIWHSNDGADLKAQIERFVQDINLHPEFSLHMLSFHHWRQAEYQPNSYRSAFRASVVTSSREQLLTRLNLLLSEETLTEPSVKRLNASTYYSNLSLDDPQPPIVLLFPGQGGLREHCLDELLVCNDAVKNSLDRAVVLESIGSQSLRDLLLSRSSNASGRLDFSSIPMAELQPLICSIQLGLCDALVSCGLQPDLLIGHSLGELTATAIAGLWTDRGAFLQLVRQRGLMMDEVCQSGASGMLATSLTNMVTLNALLQECVNTHVSNFNSPSQVTISGPINELERLASQIKANGEKATLLKVSGGFHSPLMERASESFASHIATSQLRSPGLKILSLVDGDYYDSNVPLALSRLSRHMTSSVDLVKGISRLDTKPHIFINIGPSLTMDKLVRQNRNNPDDIHVSLDDGSNEIDGYYSALSHLFCLIPNFRPDLGRHLPPLLRQPYPFESPAPSATVCNGMAHMVGDVPFPSARPPLTADSMPVAPPEFDSSRQQVQSERQAPLQPSSMDKAKQQPKAIMGKSSSLSPSTMSPLDGKTSLEIFSLYSENLRQLLASQERVAMALLSQCTSDSFNGSIPLPASSAPFLTPSPAVPAPSSDQSFAGLSFGFLDPLPTSRTPIVPIAGSPLQASVLEASPSPAIEAASQSKPTPEPSSEAVAPSHESSAPEFATLLIGITSDLTGYPIDMLEPSLALEADLGIDSIKRVEIFARLQDAVSTQQRDLIKVRIDDLAAAPKIGDIIDILSSLTEASEK